MRAFALVALLAVPGALAQLTDIPDIATATLATATAEAPTTTQSTTGATGTTAGTTRTTGGTTGGTTSATTSAGTTAQATTVTAINPGSTSQTTSASTSGSSTVNIATGTTFHLTDLPTIQGAGIPTLVIPFTADAPFMQKSSLPEGTVFIAVGATLAFLGACVLLWRVLVAWSINRSVKRAAMVSVRGPEKSTAWGSSTRQGYQKKEYEPGNNMSMDALTSSGKPIKSFRDQDNNSRGSGAVPPAGLFFSPTANAQQRNSAVNPDGNRSSSYLPAGYYASPSAQAAGGAGTTMIGSSLAPYARANSMNTPSPPLSPALPPAAGTYNRSTSRDGVRNQPRALQSGPRIRQPSATRGQTTSSFYRQSGASNLTASNIASNEHLAGQRAPSALLDDLFDQHGTRSQR
jgi:hypothetical protein